jgi:hypothetical protein
MPNWGTDLCGRNYPPVEPVAPREMVVVELRGCATTHPHRSTGEKQDFRLGEPVTDHGMQHRERVPGDARGDRQPARHD